AASPPSPPPPPLADGVVLDSSATRLLHLLVFLLPPSPLPLLAASFPASSATSQIHLRSPLPSSTTPWVSKKDKQKVNFFNLTGTLSRQSTCKWPRRAASLQPPVGNKENNISQNRHHVLDCQTPCEGKGAATSKKRKNKPAGGFNLRKSIAWNPAFFTEQGVLDNTELSMLTGSQVKATRSPASGFSSTFSPLSRFGKSSNTSVLKEVGENSRGKFPSKCLSAENKGRKLFASSKASEQDERKAPAGTQDKRSAKAVQKSIPRPPAGYKPKKVPNSSGTAQIQRIPKKSEPSPSVVSRSRSTSSVTNVPKPTTRPATVTSERTHKVEGLPLESKTERSSVIKSSGPTIGKNMVSAYCYCHLPRNQWFWEM
ncbi:Os11g0103100, partial [Oryza sativa Japonica Group]